MYVVLLDLFMLFVISVCLSLFLYVFMYLVFPLFISCVRLLVRYFVRS